MSCGLESIVEDSTCAENINYETQEQPVPAMESLRIDEDQPIQCACGQINEHGTPHATSPTGQRDSDVTSPDFVVEESNEPDRGIFDLPISYRGTVLQIAISAADSLGSLKSRVADLTGIERQNQKLSAKGKLLTSDKDTTSIAELFGLPSEAIPNPKTLPKLLLIGTSSRSIAEIQEESRKIQATLANRKKFVATSAVASSPIRTLSSDPTSKFTFLSTSILPSPPYPNPGGAVAILERIRNDPAIRHIMAEHQYTVGLLSELSPFEKTILGFNKNKGMEISLRLRTDNLEGFRSYGSIRKVLIHELTHMEISEHDVSFNTLNSKLTKEVLAFERKMTQEGRTLGGMEYDYGDDESLTEGGSLIDAHGYEGSSATGLKAEAGGLRSEEWRERERTMDRRDVLRLAVEQRLGGKGGKIGSNGEASKKDVSKDSGQDA